MKELFSTATISYFNDEGIVDWAVNLWNWTVMTYTRRTSPTASIISYHKQILLDYSFDGENAIGIGRLVAQYVDFVWAPRKSQRANLSSSPNGLPYKP